MPARPRALWFSTAVLVLVPMLVVVLVRVTHHVPIERMTRDLAAISGLAVWNGFLSFVGVLYWIAAAAVALFSAALVAGRSFPDERFLLVLGGGLAWLGLDDLFMLHEDVLPSLGVPEAVIKAGYALLVAGFVVVSRRRFRGTDAALGIVALVLLAGSLAIDTTTSGGPTSTALEDLAKFGGITCVLIVTVRVAFATVTAGQRNAESPVSSTVELTGDSGYPVGGPATG